MRDHNFRPRLDFIFRVPFFRVSDQTLSGPVHVCEIHRVRADAGKLRTLVCAGVAAFGFGHDFSDRAPAESAGPELQSLIKAIAQLVPMSSGNEFADDSRIKFG